MSAAIEARGTEASARLREIHQQLANMPDLGTMAGLPSGWWLTDTTLSALQDQPQLVEEAARLRAAHPEIQTEIAELISAIAAAQAQRKREALADLGFHGDAGRAWAEVLP